MCSLIVGGVGAAWLSKAHEDEAVEGTVLLPWNLVSLNLC